MQNHIDRLDHLQRPLGLLEKQWQRKYRFAKQAVFVFASTSCLSLPFPSAAKAQIDPYFVSELAPGETQPFITAITDLQVKQKPDPSSQDVTGFVIKKGSTIHIKHSVYQTLIPNKRTLIKPYKLEVINHGRTKYISKKLYYSQKKPILLRLETGDVINVLQYRAEGDFFFEHNSNVYSGFCSPCHESPSVTAWWVKTTLNNTTGWLLVDNRTVQIENK
tara:strand:- start:10350 stop:11006 length:657 start_codon:yes stop_codon:yes gene_type:complete